MTHAWNDGVEVEEAVRDAGGDEEKVSGPEGNRFVTHA